MNRVHSIEDSKITVRPNSKIMTRMVKKKLRLKNWKKKNQDKRNQNKNRGKNRDKKTR